MGALWANNLTLLEKQCPDTLNKLHIYQKNQLTQLYQVFRFRLDAIVWNGGLAKMDSFAMILVIALDTVVWVGNLLNNR